MRQQLMQAEKMTLMGRLVPESHMRSAIRLRDCPNLSILSRRPIVTRIARAAEDALEVTKRIETVIENTLNLARFTPRAASEQINELVRQVLGFVKISVQQKEIQFDTALIPDLPRPASMQNRYIRCCSTSFRMPLTRRWKADMHVSTGIEPWVSADGLDTEAIVVRSATTAGNIRRTTSVFFEQFYTTRKAGRVSVSVFRGRSWRNTRERSVLTRPQMVVRL
jgi:hypothetical protein